MFEGPRWGMVLLGELRGIGVGLPHVHGAVFVIGIARSSRGGLDGQASNMVALIPLVMGIVWREHAGAVGEGVLPEGGVVRTLHDVSVQYGGIQDG